MSDYMAQKADDQIEAGLQYEQRLLNEIADFDIKRKAVIEYCYDHLEQMWAARTVGILLGCDFRDAKFHADIYLESL